LTLVKGARSWSDFKSIWGE